MDLGSQQPKGTSKDNAQPCFSGHDCHQLETWDILLKKSSEYHPWRSSLLPGQVLDQSQDMLSLTEPFRGPRLCEEKSLLGTTELVPSGDQI